MVKGTSTTVKDLQEGKKYAFRVKAVNIYGTSEPLEGDSFTAKNPFGEFIWTLLVLFFFEWASKDYHELITFVCSFYKVNNDSF